MISDQEILCALCRSAMWQQPCDLDLSPGISDEQWQRIYMNSVRHGVLALALDGVMRLPKELQPEFNTRIKWGYNAEVIAKRYNAQKATAEKLAAIFAEKGIRTMVMKGIGLSLYYPLPRQRPFGDIDIYLFGEQKRGDEIAGSALIYFLEQRGALRFGADLAAHSIGIAVGRAVFVNGYKTLGFHSGEVRIDGILPPAFGDGKDF